MNLLIRIRRAAAILFAVLVLAVVAPPTWACPMCSESLPSENTAAVDESGQTTGPRTAEGFYYSILMMLAVPYTLAGAAGGYIYYLWRQKQPGQPVDAADSSQA